MSPADVRPAIVGRSRRSDAPAVAVVIVLGALLAACAPPPARAGARALDPPPLPAPIANNAVAAVRGSAGWTLLSTLGIDSTKIWSGVTTTSYRWDEGAPAWREIAPPPGPGRLAATAQTVGALVYVLGGYTVAADGAERSVPEVDVYDPVAETWRRAAPIPIPVDDAVSGVWRDSLIYLVSGWHDTDNEAAVQVYDPANDAWAAATPIPGPPVFGHAGGISGDAIVYVDGTRVDRDPRAFRIEPSSWIGRIDPTRPSEIAWERLPDHPGPPLYRAAAIGAGDRVVFAGGSDNPYNFDGVGYDGRPSEPSAAVFAYDVVANAWLEAADLEVATMDHRNLVAADGRLYSIGGMVAGQTVTTRVADVRFDP